MNLYPLNSDGKVDGSDNALAIFTAVWTFLCSFHDCLKHSWSQNRVGDNPNFIHVGHANEAGLPICYVYI